MRLRVLIAYPDCPQSGAFANNRIGIGLLKRITVVVDGLCNYPLLKEHMPHIDCRIISILRNDDRLNSPARKQTIIEAGDENYLYLCNRTH